MENFSADLQEERFKQHACCPCYLGLLENPHGRANGVGSCGDSIEFTLKLAGGRIISIGHQPHGCAFTTACASAVSKLAVNRTIDDALLITPDDVILELGGLPEDHHHCARLAVNTLGEAIASVFENTVRSRPEKGVM